MGSEKYPKENEFDTFLQENGGGSNAYTDSNKVKSRNLLVKKSKKIFSKTFSDCFLL